MLETPTQPDTESVVAARGRFVWYELLTTDPAAARAFYSGIVGWGTQQWDGESGYTLWTVGDTPIGGLMALPAELAGAGTPPHWFAHVCVPDVDATARLAEELGGRVLQPPTDTPDVGRWTVLADPQGAVIAAFMPAGEAPGHVGAPRLGDIAWHELATTDHATGFDFYARLFGWEKTDSFDMGPMGEYLMYGRGGQTYGGMFTRPPEWQGPASWVLYIHVDDVDQAAERVQALGGQIVNGPMDVPGGDRIVQGLDPQGAFFALHSSASQS